MAKKIDFMSGDLNGNGKSGFFERMLGLDPGIRAAMGAWRGLTGNNKPDSFSNPYKRQSFDFNYQQPVNDFHNSFGVPSNTGLSYGKTDPWSNPYKRQEFGLSNPQMPVNPQAPKDMFDPKALTQFGNTGLAQAVPQIAPNRITPTQMPVRNGLDFMDTQGSAYQSRFAPQYQNPMSQNNGYFNMGNAGTAGGNWVNGAGWRTDANKAMGQTKEDMAFNAQMARRLGDMNQ